MSYENEHYKKCLLHHVCRVKGTNEHCKTTCPQFVALHGLSGEGGRVGEANTPREYRYSTVQTSKAREDEPEAYKIIDIYEKSFTRFFDQTTDTKTRIKNLYLWSEEPGTGKTVTATSLLNNFLIRYYIGASNRGISPASMPVYFLGINQFQTDFLTMTRSGVPREIQEEAGNRYYDSIEKAKSAEIVVFDDIGIRSVSEAFRSDILSIIDHRIYNMKPSIFTSNLPIDSLPELFNEKRLFDRIRDLAIEIEFNGKSKRGTRK